MEQSVVSQKHCANCSTEVHDAFCQRCGQKFRDDRLSLKMLASELPSQWFSVDRGFFYTFWQQLSAPGTVAKRYVNGERVKFTNPLTYYLIGAAVQLLMLWVMADAFRDQMVTQVQQNPEMLQQLQATLGDNAAQKYADIYINVVNQGYTYLGFIFFCLPFAFLMRIFSKRHRHQHNGAETLVLSFYTMGQFVMLTGLMGFITVSMGSVIHPALSLVIYYVFSILSVRGFYPPGQRGYIATFFALTLTFILFIIVLLVALSIGVANYSAGY